MSAVTMTEAEQERAARAKIDRLAQIRREHAERKGISPHDVQLGPADFARADREEEPAVEGRPGSASTKILEACRDLADTSGNVDRARLYEAIGAITPDAKSKANALIYSLRGQGRFPWMVDGFGRKPKGASPPKAEISALKRRVNGEPPPPKAAPKPAPAPAPEPDPPAVGYAHPTGPARLAELAADWCRRIDEMGCDERAFLLAFVRHRYA
jgi:hypothetical protein